MRAALTGTVRSIATPEVGQLLAQHEVLDGSLGTTTDGCADERHEEHQRVARRSGRLPRTCSGWPTAFCAPTGRGRRRSRRARAAPTRRRSSPPRPRSPSPRRAWSPSSAALRGDVPPARRRQARAHDVFGPAGHAQPPRRAGGGASRPAGGSDRVTSSMLLLYPAAPGPATPRRRRAPRARTAPPVGRHAGSTGGGVARRSNRSGVAGRRGRGYDGGALAHGRRAPRWLGSWTGRSRW